MLEVAEDGQQSKWRKVTLPKAGTEEHLDIDQTACFSDQVE
jgi:hypothetical protein